MHPTNQNVGFVLEMRLHYKWYIGKSDFVCCVLVGDRIEEGKHTEYNHIPWLNLPLI